MKVQFMPQAEAALFEIGTWVEMKNTEGSGARFVNRFIDKIVAYALPNAKYPDCKETTLQLMGLQCIAIDNWIVAFSIRANIFMVHYILHGSNIR